MLGLIKLVVLNTLMRVVLQTRVSRLSNEGERPFKVGTTSYSELLLTLEGRQRRVPSIGDDSSVGQPSSVMGPVAVLFLLLEGRIYTGLGVPRVSSTNEFLSPTGKVPSRLGEFWVSFTSYR